MSEYDLKRLFEKWIELDHELKELKAEVSQIKWYQQNGTNGPVQFRVNKTSKTSDKPAQWPNEPYKDYLKRIGEYNEAQVYEDDTK